ncbi:MAG: hypothetical protein JO336_17330 [Acidobacteriia bacterium]|nr:hypothetical protein [Terriglobia bacterium]MBV8904855.1 hypothetical protein [Terriglobia bacterium]
MNKLRFVTIAVLCGALAAPVAVWAADGSQPDSGTSGQSADLTRLKAQLEQQQKQIDALTQALAEQKKLLDKAIEAKSEGSSEPSAATPASDRKAPNLGDVASTTPIIPRGVAPALTPITIPIAAAAQVVPPAGTAGETIPDSPLQVRIGNTAITPVGFMDATDTFRSTNSGASLATNFGNYPYNNNLPSGRLTNNLISLRNSRIGARFDSLYKGYHVLAYWESDFVGQNAANNLLTTSNSQLFRMRLYWVDIRKDKVEFLAGQSWSMMTPNRRQISALPGDLFYGQEFDVNYLNGLTWGRIPGYRFLYHPNNKITWGIAAENADQYFGGSGGGGTPTLPAALTALVNTELDANQTSGENISNVHPDIISKLAFDPSSRVHVELAGVFDTVKTFNPNTTGPGAQKFFTSSGGGGSFNSNFEVVKNFRLIENFFWSDGAGRYLFGEAPNFILRADGSPSMMHSGSTVDGFEWTLGKSNIYGYYGGIYVGRNTALDANGTSLIGYGYRGSANSQNRTMQEATIGITQTLYRDPKYGQVSFYLDYAYFFRRPWYVAPNSPKEAFQHAVWFDLRYTLPGSAPTIGY